MTLFGQQFRRLGSPLLIHQFGESVTYHPFNYVASDTRASRSISVIVVRNQLRQDDDVPGAVLPVFTIQVRNDVLLGITSDELDLGNDQISFPVRVGSEAERRTIIQLLSHDSAMLTLECR